MAASHNCWHTQNCWQNSCCCYARATWLKLISSFWYAALQRHWALNINASAILLRNENWKWSGMKIYRWKYFYLDIPYQEKRLSLWRCVTMWRCTQSCPILACSKPTVGNCLVFIYVGLSTLLVSHTSDQPSNSTQPYCKIIS